MKPWTSDTIPESFSIFDLDQLFDSSIRMDMIEEQLRTRGIRMERVIQSMLEIPRHRFLPSKFIMQSYDDLPIPLGYHRTVYQPYIVALMAESADIQPTDNVLEIGTGSGYNTAILSRLGGSKVTSLESIEELFEEAMMRLANLGLIEEEERAMVEDENREERKERGISHVHKAAKQHHHPLKSNSSNVSRVQLRHIEDLSSGYEEHAPYNVIVVNPPVPDIPSSLFHQLAINGRLIAPMVRNNGIETLSRYTRLDGDTLIEEVILEQRNPYYVNDMLEEADDDRNDDGDAMEESFDT
jgi:protein-L-isoaspartate(D-aspartate) O-methyltransferase